MSIPLIIAGALGRMGQAVIELALLQNKFHVESAVARSESLHKKPDQWSFPLYSDLSFAVINNKSIIIDFSSAELLPHHLSVAEKTGSGILIATTAHPPTHHKAIEKAALTIPIVVAPNTSLMASAMLSCVEFLATTLPDVSAAILDVHHIHKKDAPSGTAKALLNAINTNAKNLEVDVHSLRQGLVIGEHTVYFFNKLERLEIFHRVEDRRVFAQGALVAAQFLFGKAPGLYTMKDVLNMNLTIKNEG